jgi:hypothetical protein
MRRQIRAVALATAALLTVTGFAAAEASAAIATPTAAHGVAAKKHPAPAKKHPAPSAGRAAREAALARGNREAADLVGYLPSLYQGKWYMPRKESIRRCILSRESHANYRVVGAGTYFGAYQMSRGLAVGATYIMQKEVRHEMGIEGVRIVRALRKVNPNAWNRYWQDRAFWTIWHHGAGKGHWGGGAHSC